MTPISCTVMDSFYCSSQPPNAFTSSTHTALVVPGSEHYGFCGDMRTYSRMVEVVKFDLPPGTHEPQTVKRSVIFECTLLSFSKDR